MKLFIISTILFALVSIQSKSIAQDTISPPNPGGITKVYTSIIVNNVSEINPANQILKADLMISARWNDPRLVHNSEGNIVVTPDKIWDPFLTFTNRLNISTSFPDHFTILKDGTVLYFQRIYGEFAQNLYFAEFPFDEQNFELRIIDIAISPTGVSLEPDSLMMSGLNKDAAPSDWTFEGWSFERSKYKLLNVSEERSSLLFTIFAERQSGYYILIFIIPLILIILMSLLVFWLPANLSASQITVGATSMLTLIAYRFIVTTNLPKISYLTRMDILILGSSILIFMTLLQSVVTSNLANKGEIELAQKIDLKCRWIFPMLYFLIAIYALFL